jgi:DNA-binding transcriptional regulator YiaG
MTPLEFRAALADLGLTQPQFARLTGYSPRIVRWWAQVDRQVQLPPHVPAAVALLRNAYVAF